MFNKKYRVLIFAMTIMTIVSCDSTKEVLVEKDVPVDPITDEMKEYLSAPMSYMGSFVEEALGGDWSSEAHATEPITKKYSDGLGTTAWGFTPLQIADLEQERDNRVGDYPQEIQDMLELYVANDTDFVTICLGAFPVTATLERTGVEHTFNNHTECRAETSDAFAKYYYDSDIGKNGNFPTKFKSDGRVQTLYGSFLGDCRAAVGNAGFTLELSDCNKYE